MATELESDGTRLVKFGHDGNICNVVVDVNKENDVLDKLIRLAYLDFEYSSVVFKSYS